MASRVVFDPVTLLRVAPVITSSFSLWYCWDQFMFFQNFIVPENRRLGSAFLPGYWKTFLTPGLTCIFTLYGATAMAAAGNIYRGSTAFWWYTAGVTLSVAHFTFAPFIIGPIEDIINDRAKGESWKDMQRWLRIHVARSLLVDFPAWVCYLLAAMQSLSPAS
jgi:hypothetical protein